MPADSDPARAMARRELDTHFTPYGAFCFWLKEAGKQVSIAQNPEELPPDVRMDYLHANSCLDTAAVETVYGKGKTMEFSLQHFDDPKVRVERSLLIEKARITGKPDLRNAIKKFFPEPPPQNFPAMSR